MNLNYKTIKKRNRNFIICLIISMLVLVTLTPIMFNFRSIFGIGIYNVEKNISNSYSDGTAGVNVQLQFEYQQFDRYTINTFIKPISTGDVVNFGFISNDVQYYNNDGYILTRSVQYGTPSVYSTYRFTNLLYKYDNFTCYGTIEITIVTGGIPTNDTINFQVSYIVPLSDEDYVNINLIVYTLFFIHFFLYIIIPVLFLWIFKPIFGLSYSEEDVERDEKFRNYLRDQLLKKERGSKK